MTQFINRHYSRGATWVLVIYLSIMVSGCTFRPAELTPEEARVLQTREFQAAPEEVARAVLIVLQEMHYTLGEVDMGLGLITADRTSEFSLAPISVENNNVTGMSDEMETFCIVAGTVAVVGVILAILFGDDDEDDDENNRKNQSRHHRTRHHSPGPVFVESNDSGSDSYHYSMTITLTETSLQNTKVRMTLQGEHLQGVSVTETGPVQSQELYIDFYNRLHQVLKY